MVRVYRGASHCSNHAIPTRHRIVSIAGCGCGLCTLCRVLSPFRSCVVMDAGPATMPRWSRSSVLRNVVQRTLSRHRAGKIDVRFEGFLPRCDWTDINCGGTHFPKGSKGEIHHAISRGSRTACPDRAASLSTMWWQSSPCTPHARCVQTRRQDGALDVRVLRLRTQNRKDSRDLNRSELRRTRYCPQFHIMPIGVDVQHGPNPPPFQRP
jgi:hypothetical protein